MCEEKKKKSVGDYLCEREREDEREKERMDVLLFNVRFSYIINLTTSFFFGKSHLFSFLQFHYKYFEPTPFFWLLLLRQPFSSLASSWPINQTLFTISPGKSPPHLPYSPPAVPGKSVRCKYYGSVRESRR